LLLAAGLTFFVRTNPIPERQRAAIVPTTRHNGWSIILHDPVMVGLLLQAIAPSLLAYPVLALIPVLARDHLGLGAWGLGLLMAASGSGAVLGAIGVAMLGSYPHKGRLLMVIGICYGCVMTAFAQSPWPLVSGVLFACSSCLGIAHNALTTALLQARAPDSLRGQVTGALTLSFGLSPIGALGMGILAEQSGVGHFRRRLEVLVSECSGCRS
jgi:hypothetical protein